MTVGSPPAINLDSPRIRRACSLTGVLLLRSGSAGNVVILNAASYSDIRILAPETIAAAFGEFRTLMVSSTRRRLAHSQPTLRRPRLGKRSARWSLLCRSRQVNFLMPRDVNFDPRWSNFDADGDPQTVSVIVSEAFPGLFVCLFRAGWLRQSQHMTA
jgi:hypothetical protein